MRIKIYVFNGVKQILELVSRRLYTETGISYVVNKIITDYNERRRIKRFLSKINKEKFESYTYVPLYLQLKSHAYGKIKEMIRRIEECDEKFKKIFKSDKEQLTIAIRYYIYGLIDSALNTDFSYKDRRVYIFRKIYFNCIIRKKIEEKYEEYKEYF